jgi:hypothetical protein
VKLSAHQPNLVPWAPFFEKCESADIFVLLGHVQFEKNNYQNRFMFDGRWQTLSVRQGIESIRDKKYVQADRDWLSIKTRIPHYADILSTFDRHISESLWSTNTEIIVDILNRLNIETQIEFDFPTELKATDRIIELCQRFKASTYLSGPSGAKYLDTSRFEEARITLEFIESKPVASNSILERLSECQ